MAGKKGMIRASKKSGYDKRIADKVCELLSQGQTLTKICRDHYPDMAPNRIVMWKYVHPEFKEAYTAARESGLELLQDEIMDSCREPVKMDGRTRDELYADMQQKRLYIDTLKFVIAKGVGRLARVQENKMNAARKPVEVTVQNYSTSAITSNIETINQIEAKPQQEIVVANWQQEDN